MKFDWKKIGIFALLGWLFTLPFFMWKNSKIGRIIFIFLFIIIGLWGANKGGDLFFKWRSKIMLDKLLEPAQNKIKELENEMSNIQVKIINFNKDLQEKSDNKFEEYQNHLNTRFSNIEKSLTEIDTAITLIRQEERENLKQKIIKLKEEVLINKKSVNSVEIRTSCEEVADKLFLLTKEEKDRFYKDLEDIGFMVQKLKKDFQQVVVSNWSCATMDSMVISTGTQYFVGEREE